MLLEGIGQSSTTRRGNYLYIFSSSIFLNNQYCVLIKMFRVSLQFPLPDDDYLDDDILGHDNADSSHLLVSRMHLCSSGHSIMS